MNSERQPPAYFLLIGLSLVFSVLAVVTMLPNPNASKPNVLGYRSVCTFAPAATALCGLLAGITCILRNRLVSMRRAATRFQPPFAAVIVLVVLTALAVVSGVEFGAVQARFGGVITRSAPAGTGFGTLTNGMSLATVEDGEVSATVEATFSGGALTDLKLVEGKNIEASVAETVFAAVLRTQSTAVDAVSGATASSNVLLKAIENAAAGR